MADKGTHKGYEFKADLRRWKCSKCRKFIKTPTDKDLVNAFKSGLSRKQVARRYGVSVRKVDEAIRKYVRPM